MKRLVMILAAVATLAVAGYAATKSNLVQSQAADDCCAVECCMPGCESTPSCP